MTPSGSERELQELREEVRGWLVDAKYGVITEGELVARADSLIAELAEPPDYLIAVSLGESLAQVPRLDMVKERIDARDLGLFAGRLLARWRPGRWTAKLLLRFVPRSPGQGMSGPKMRGLASPISRTERT